jgi:hypothetical protein
MEPFAETVVEAGSAYADWDISEAAVASEVIFEML